MGGDAATKRAQWQMRHQLSEHELALVHDGPARIRAKDRNLVPRRSNRDQTKRSRSSSRSTTYTAPTRERWDTTDLWIALSRGLVSFFFSMVGALVLALRPPERGFGILARTAALLPYARRSGERAEAGL